MTLFTSNRFLGRLLLLATLLALIPTWSAAEADLETVVLEVRGMSSSMCELQVKGALAGVDGVEVISVDRTKNEAIARIQAKTVSAQHLVDVVNKVGYPTRLQGEGTPATSRGDLSSEELDRVADWMAKRIIQTGSPAFEDSEVFEATAVRVTEDHRGVLTNAVMDKLEEMGALGDLLAGSRCAQYEACSIYGDLSGATGEILDMYVTEKAEDGQRFENFILPEFTAHNLAGEEVSLSGLRGSETLLVFLAVHCRHSLDSLPILNHLADSYGPRGINVVGVYINSGSIEDLNAWLPELEPRFEIWGFNDPSLADLVESHLVPVYFFLDAQGRLLEKLVGQKSREEVLASFSANFEVRVAAR